jgi:hypothetical protein
MKVSKKITSILIIASISLTALVGCSSKSTDTNAETSNSKQPFANGQARNRNFDPVAMKTLYSNVLKSLVTSGTITQIQSNKVLAAETKNTAQSIATSKPTGTAVPKGTNKPNGRRPTNDRLSVLVTSKVITLAQFTTINQKNKEAMKTSMMSKTTQN